MKMVRLAGGEEVPALGQGAWKMGDARSRRPAEIAALRRGIELGMTLIDTAEMYGDGRSEELIAEAVGDQRDRLFLVSKVYPHNADRRGMREACERSLKRLRTDRLDLYLLHWRGSLPLDETVEGFARLVEAGKIRHWGVSNFDTDDMKELHALGGKACAADQILYNITRRGPEFDLLPWLVERHTAAMAYSPVEQGSLPARGALAQVAARHGVSIFRIALAFVLRRPGVIAIPKAGSVAHVEDNRAALDLTLDEDDLRALDATFKPPLRKQRLDML